MQRIFIYITSAVFGIIMIPVLSEIFESLSVIQTRAVVATSAIILALSVILATINFPGEIEDGDFETKTDSDLGLLSVVKDGFFFKIQQTQKKAESRLILHRN